MWNVSGYNHIISYFEKAIKTERLGHSYLFVGPTGVGKKTLAINLAQVVNCKDQNPPCGSCSQCSRIFRGIHPDVRVLGVNREEHRMIIWTAIQEIQRESYLEPFEGAFRVYIIDEAEKLTEEAANQFLKLLEEPPSRVIFILLSQDSDLLLPTIASRCHQIPLRPLSKSVISLILKNQHGASESESSLLASLSEGRLGWAIRAKSDPEILEQWSHLSAKFLFLGKAGIPERFEFAQELASLFSKDPWSVHQILAWWIFWWRVLFLVHCDPNELTKYPKGFLGVEAIGKDYQPIESVQFIKAIQETSVQLESNVNPRLALESLVLTLPTLH